jgi:hypothetical protein
MPRHKTPKPSIQNPELYAKIKNQKVIWTKEYDFSYPTLTLAEKDKLGALEHYYQTQFTQDLETLAYRHPNPVIMNNLPLFKIDAATKFFGGMEWENFDDDLASIANKEAFIYCLFVITIIDLVMFTYFQHNYEHFRNGTQYPKFGWCGYGPHYENPKKMLLKSEENGILDVVSFQTTQKAYLIFIGTLFSKTGVDAKEFIQAMLNDPDFQPLPSENQSIYTLIYEGFKTAIQAH